jgi:hypothetical protein
MAYILFKYIYISMYGLKQKIACTTATNIPHSNDLSIRYSYSAPGCVGPAVCDDDRHPAVQNTEGFLPSPLLRYHGYSRPGKVEKTLEGPTLTRLTVTVEVGGERLSNHNSTI